MLGSARWLILVFVGLYSVACTDAGTNHAATAIVDSDPSLLYGLNLDAKHVSLPDVQDYCGHPILAVRLGESHASDKGITALFSLGNYEQPQITISNETLDVRNGYLVVDNSRLYLYASLYDYTLPTGFHSSMLFEVADDCSFHINPIEVEHLPYHVIYAPIDLSTGVFAEFNSGYGWCVALSKWENCYWNLTDEEIVVFEADDAILGVGRGGSDEPLVLYEFFEDGSYDSSIWCSGLRTNGGVSPKLREFNGLVYLMWAERGESGRIRLMSFAGYEELRDCEALKTVTIDRPDAGLDFGYPALASNGYIHWYEESMYGVSVYSKYVEEMFK